MTARIVVLRDERKGRDSRRLGGEPGDDILDLLEQR